MINSEIRTISKKRFETLANTRDKYCVSIFLPMYKSGKEQNQRLGPAILKTCLKEIHKTLTEYNIREREVNTLLKPVKDLIADVTLWRNPSDGLAIFLDNQNGMQYYLIPLPLETFTYVADHFYLKPLLPLYHNDGTYYLLELSQDHVKLYKASRNTFEDLFVEEFAPEQLEEAVGFDFKQKMLQFRTGHALYPAGSFHGQGEGKDDEKKELISFFRKIDEGVKKIINNKNAPLVIAGVDWLYPLYKKINSYPNLYETNVSGDPEFKNKGQLHLESWGLVHHYFERTKKEKLAQFAAQYHTSKTSNQISEIIPAAVNGKIAALFIRKGADVFGSFKSKNGCLILDSEKEIHNASLLNLVAVETFLKGGQVYIMEPEDMPVKKRTMNALFRY